MRHYLHIVSAAAAVLAWGAPASAAPPEPDTEIAIASNSILATWILIDARETTPAARAARRQFSWASPRKEGATGRLSFVSIASITQ